MKINKIKSKRSVTFLILIFLVIKVQAEFFNSALVIYQQQSNTEISEYRKRYELAKILLDQEKYVEAYKKILPLTELKIEDLDLSIKVNYLIGKILLRNNEDIKSIEYFKRSLSLIEKNDLDNNKKAYSLLKAKNYIDLSKVYLTLKKTDSTVFYISKLDDIESIDSRVLNIKSIAYMNLGNIYLLKDTLRKEDSRIAKKYMLKAIEIQTKLEDNLSLALSYMNLATVYVEMGDYKKGKNLYDKALGYLKYDKSLKAILYKEALFDNKAWALYNLEDHTAYEFVTKSYAIRDSLNTEKLSKDIKEIEARHNVDIVKKAEEVKRIELEKKTWIIGITGFIVSFLFLYLANLYKLRQRNLSLKLSQNELKQQRKLERLKSQSQVKILNATIDGKETERKQIAEILHDNVSALLSSASMHLHASQKQFNGHIPIEIAKTQEIINEASQKIRDLSHNLMSSILLKFGLEYAVKDAAKKYSNSSIKINTAIHNVYRYSQDYEIKIFNIIQELINNILKHSSAKNAYIIMEEEEETMNIIVKDDGVGFKNKKEGEKGVGLNQIKARIHMMNGTFLIESSKGQGTKAIIKIPVVRKKAPKKHLA